VEETVAHSACVQRVLVAFDGSDEAWRSLREAIAVAEDHRALLTIVGVVEEPLGLWMGLGAMSVPYTRERLRHDLEREMRVHLAEARDEVPASVSVTTLIVCGRPARVAARLAEAGGYDVVVACRRRPRRLGWLIGG
jgi:nucleotide-binding universal stress UspA family protein